MRFYEEDDYLRALVAYSSLESRIWLKRYFELFKSTLLWPPGKPYIDWPVLIKGTLKEKFNSTYRETLLTIDHEIDNVNQTLKLLE
jgi:hypothetical protein